MFKDKIEQRVNKLLKSDTEDSTLLINQFKIKNLGNREFINKYQKND